MYNKQYNPIMGGRQLFSELSHESHVIRKLKSVELFYGNPILLDQYSNTDTNFHTRIECNSYTNSRLNCHTVTDTGTELHTYSNTRKIPEDSYSFKMSNHANTQTTTTAEMFYQ